MTNSFEDIPRRSQMQQWSVAEYSIFSAIQTVEFTGCHPLLTEAVQLLVQAKEKVADFVDQEQAQVKTYSCIACGQPTDGQYCEPCGKEAFKSQTGHSLPRTEREKSIEAEDLRRREMREGLRFDTYESQSCPNCGRTRVAKRKNGKRICEKCCWDIDENAYDSGALSL